MEKIAVSVAEVTSMLVAVARSLKSKPTLSKLVAVAIRLKSKPTLSTSD
jgi:hypothetical protein